MPAPSGQAHDPRTCPNPQGRLATAFPTTGPRTGQEAREEEGGAVCQSHLPTSHGLGEGGPGVLGVAFGNPQFPPLLSLLPSAAHGHGIIFILPLASRLRRGGQGYR